MMAAGTEQYITVADPSLLPVLPSSIDNVVTSFSVSATARLPVIKTGQTCHITIDTETMEVTGISGTSLTVVRGSEGTTATSHLAGAAVSPVLSAEALRRLLPVINVCNPGYGLTPLVGDNSTDNTAAFQAIIDYAAAHMPAVFYGGVEFYVPAGLYKFTGKVEFGSLRSFTLRGAGNWRGGSFGAHFQGGPANDYLCSIDGALAGSPVAVIEGISFAGTWGGLYINQANQFSIRSCLFSGSQWGLYGIDNIYALMLVSCQFGGPGVGLMVHSGGGCVIVGCDFESCSEAMRIGGPGVSVIGTRIEVCDIGLNLGVDQNGANDTLNCSSFNGIQFEACQIAVNLNAVNSCVFNGILPYSDHPPTAGQPVQYGFRFKSVTSCAFNGIQIQGSYNGASIFGPGVGTLGSVNSCSFNGVNAPNGGTGATWVNRGTTNCEYTACSIDVAPANALVFDSFANRQLHSFDNGTLISSRASNLGGTPTIVNAGNDLKILEHAVIASNPGIGNEILAIWESGQANVTAVINGWPTGGSAPDFGVIVRYQDSSNYWLLIFDSSQTTNNFSIYEKSAGVLTSKATTTVPLGGSVGSVIRPFQLRFNVTGANVFTGTCVDITNGTNYTVTFTSTDFSTATKCGIRVYRSTTGLTLEPFSVTSP